MEAVETLIRESMHAAGARAIERLLAVPVVHQTAVACGCGQQARYRERRGKQVLTILGPVTLERAYYLCPNCHEGQSPRDQELDVVGTE